MPARDPKTGKPLSGAQKRARAAAKSTSSYKARAAKKPAAKKPAAASAAPAPAASTASPASDFDRLPPAPIGDPAGAIAWANDAMLIALDQILRDTNLAAPERWGWLEKFGKALGYLKDKSAEQHAIKRALSAQQAQVQAQGTVSAAGRFKTAVSRPPS